MKMHSPAGFVCVFGTRKATIPLQNDLPKLLSHCGAAFGVQPGLIAGFQHGDLVIPASFVGLAGTRTFAGQTLTLLVDNNTFLSEGEETHSIKRVGSFEVSEDNNQGPVRKNVRFYLVGNQTVLVTKKDLNGILSLSQGLLNKGITAKQVAHSIAKIKDGEAVEEDAFFSVVMSTFLPSNITSTKNKERIRSLYERTFFSFDRAGSGSVNWKDLAGSIMLLASGTQYEKLHAMFELFDSNRDGLLSVRQLVRFVGCQLTILLALNTGMSMLPSRYVYSLIEETTEATVKSILKDGEGGQHVSFDDYHRWYNSEGRIILPWVEVLTVSKSAEQLVEWMETQEASEDISHLLMDTLETSRGSPRASSPQNARRLRFSFSETNTPKIPIEHEDDETDDDDDDETLSDDENGTNQPPPRDGGAKKDREDNGDSPLFRFRLSKGNEFVLRTVDAEVIDLIVSTTRLGELGTEEVHAFFLSELTNANIGSEITKELFDKCLRTLVPASSLGKQEQRYLSYTFSTLFFAFDRERKTTVPADEFLSGFSLLTRGSKSSKLLLSWGLFDSDQDGLLETISLVRFIRSFLTILFALQKDSTKLSAVQTYELIDSTAVEIVRDVVEFNKKKDHEGISFEEFGHWYNDRGQNMASWLELLDLSKWAVSKGRQVTIQTQASVDLDGDQVEDEDGEMDEVVFQIPLGTDEGDEVLVFTGADVTYLEDLIALSDLEQMDPDEIHAALLRESRGSDISISRLTFVACLKSLLGFEELEDEEWIPLENALFDFFSLYDKNNQGRGPTEEIACGMSLLAGGKKSDKLALGFGLFDRDRDGCLSEAELSRFLGALLLGLYGFTNLVKTMPKEQIWSISAFAAAKAARMILHAVNGDKGRQEKISFDDFAEWYVEGGFEVIPWIELYDLQKWPLSLMLPGDESGEQDGDDGYDETQEIVHGKGKIRPSSPLATPGNSSRQSPIVLSFSLSETQDVKLEVSERDVLCVQSMAHKSGFSKLSAKELETKLKKYAVKPQIIKADGFQKFLMEELTAVKNISSSERQNLFTSFFSLYYMYEQAEPGPVSVNKVLCGMLLFASGKKSDKLSRAFAAFDEDQDGCLSRTQMYTFFMSFLVGLFASHVCSGEQALPDTDEKVRFDALSECVLGLTAEIFKQTPDRPANGLIDFSSFADWYTAKGGYALIPWLELLDLRKWKMALGGTEDEELETSARKVTSSNMGEKDNARGPQKLGFGTAAAKAAPSLNQSSTTKGLVTKRDSDIMFVFEMPGELSLTYIRSDLLRLQRLINLSKFDETPPDSIFALFGSQKEVKHRKEGEEEWDEYILKKEAFDSVVRSMIDGSKLNSEDRTFVSVFVSSIFSAFDRHNRLEVPLIEFCSGFLVLCSGSKSEKLSVAFDVFDREDKRSLSSRQFGRFLRSFLTILFALNEESCDSPADLVWLAVDSSVELKVNGIFHDLQLDPSIDRLTFRDFATWYSETGHEIMPWLELLNLSKFLDALR